MSGFLVCTALAATVALGIAATVVDLVGGHKFAEDHPCGVDREQAPSSVVAPMSTKFSCTER